MMSPKVTRVHELIHVLLGPAKKNWPMILAEFLANAGSLNRKFLYKPEDTNDPSVSFMQDWWAGAFNGVQTYFSEMRDIVLAQLSQSMSDEQRIALIQEAIAKGHIPFQHLPQFMEKFGLNHAIFHPGREGTYQHAFPSRTYDNRQFVLLVHFKRLMKMTIQKRQPLVFF